MLQKSSFSNGRLIFLTISAPVCFLVILLLALTGGVPGAEGAADFGVSNSDVQLDTFTPEQGSEVTVTVTVTNQGQDPGNLTIDLYDGATHLGQQNRTAMDGGTDATLTFAWAIPAEAPLGAHELRVELNSEQDHQDTNDQARLTTVVYHPFDSDEGDLRITKGRTYANYLHDGHIWISSNGQLDLEQAAGEDRGLFEIEQDTSDQFYILVQDTGVLHLKAGTILRSNRPLTLFLEENARLTVDEGALLQVKRIVARNNSLIVVNGGRIEASLDLELSNLLMAGDGEPGPGRLARLSGTSATISTSPANGATSFLNSKLDFEVLHLEVDGKLETNRSTFAIEDIMTLRAASSTMVDTLFTRGLTNLETGTHHLTNVSTPRVVVSGDAMVHRYWYLTVKVIDVGENVLPGAEVSWRPTQTTQTTTAATDERGVVVFTLEANITSAAGDDFAGNYEVRAKYGSGEPLDWHSLTLKGLTSLTLQMPEVRITTQYIVKVLIFSGGTQVTHDRLVEGGSQLQVRVSLTFKDASRDPAPGVPVTVSIKNEKGSESGQTNSVGVFEITLEAPKESGTYTIEARVAGSSNPSTNIKVEGDDGTFGGRDLAVLFLAILAVLGVVVILIQRVNQSYPTEVAQCGGCGQRIPLDSETCPECGEKLDPYEAFDPNESSWVARKEEA